VAGEEVLASEPQAEGGKELIVDCGVDQTDVLLFLVVAY
jgi:hypothetical protein